MMRHRGYMSIRALAALTCWLIIAASVVVGLALHRSRSLTDDREGVIALSPALGRLLFQVGAGDAVVGVSEFTELPPGVHRPVVGDSQRINRERALWLQPRVIVYQQSLTDALRRLGRDGIALEQVGIEKVEDITLAMDRLVQIAGKGDARPAINKIRSDMDAVAKAVKGRIQPRVLLTMHFHPIGRDNFLDELLTAAGGTNAWPQRGYSAKVFNPEQIGRLAPQVIIDLADKSAVANASAMKARLDSWAAFSNVPAVQYGKVFIVTDPSITIPDVHVGESAMKLARLIHPEAFEAATQPDSTQATRPDEP